MRAAPRSTTAPNNYSATIAVSKAGAAGATVTFALTAGSLPPGLTMPASSGSGIVITGNPTQAGTFNFTIKATDGGLTSTLAYQITVTVQGPPDQLLCTAANGSYLISGVCELPDAIVGLPYQGHLTTSHNAGGTLSIVAGALPAGPDPARHLRAVRRHRRRYSRPAGHHRGPPSPCRAPATRASPCTRSTRSRWTRTSR